MGIAVEPGELSEAPHLYNVQAAVSVQIERTKQLCNHDRSWHSLAKTVSCSCRCFWQGGRFLIIERVTSTGFATWFGVLTPKAFFNIVFGNGFLILRSTRRRRRRRRNLGRGSIAARLAGGPAWHLRFHSCLRWCSRSLSVDQQGGCSCGGGSDCFGGDLRGNAACCSRCPCRVSRLLRGEHFPYWHHRLFACCRIHFRCSRLSTRGA
mmetsp:Transcript_2813/g.5213  ORF Transcript_2813/g.5213 Transcript_2813/m.5213 type:complete len:208 (-) Transcript_2813:1163-1786(-)